MARLAKAHDFEGYARELLAGGPFRQARNFQTQRLASNEPPQKGSEGARAMRALESLPFVGLVEAYDQSVARLAELLAPHIPDSKATTFHEN